MKNCGEQELTRHEFCLTYLGSFDVQENSSSRIFIWTGGNEKKLSTEKKKYKTFNQVLGTDLYVHVWKVLRSE